MIWTISQTTKQYGKNIILDAIKLPDFEILKMILSELQLHTLK